MFHIVLFEPEIPPNTGNIIRLCANTGSSLHLVRPLGFELDDKRLQRAGLDYHEYAEIQLHDNIGAIFAFFTGKRIFTCTTKAKQHYNEVFYQPDDVFLLGPETRGLPAEILNHLGPEAGIRIPMLSTSRSLNLSNAASVILYEALRQNAFQALG